jgi:hypothetical protein
LILHYCRGQHDGHGLFGELPSETLAQRRPVLGIAA